MQSSKQLKSKPKVDFMELLAYNATDSSRKLLEKYGKPDAKGYADLQHKLADLYRSESDKIAIEKEFAAIHPHRDFILKYLSPPPVKTNVIIPEPASAAEGSKDQPLDPNKDSLKREFLIATVAIVAIAGVTIYALKQK